MNQKLKHIIGRAVYRTVSKAPAKVKDDPLALSELLMDAIDFAHDLATEEEGIAVVPPSMRDDDVPWEVGSTESEAQPNIVLPPAASAAVSPVPEQPKRGPEPKRLIALPGDKEFADSKPVDVPLRRVISAKAVKAKAKPVPLKPVWDDGPLMAAILEQTPDKVTFTPAGMEETGLKYPAIRNCHSDPGIGCRLTYRHPSVSEDSSGLNDLQLLIASKHFSVYEESIDIDAAMAEIVEQLRNRYKPRSPEMEPHSSGAPPALSDRPMVFDTQHNPMGDSQSDRFRPGAAQEDPGRVLNDLRRSNNQLAPSGSRFDK